MKQKEEKPIGKFSIAMAERQQHRDKFFDCSEEALKEERRRIIQHIVRLDSINVSQKDRDDMEERLYSQKREVERKLKNIYGQY